MFQEAKHWHGLLPRCQYSYWLALQPHHRKVFRVGYFPFCHSPCGSLGDRVLGYLGILACVDSLRATAEGRRRGDRQCLNQVPRVLGFTWCVVPFIIIVALTSCLLHPTCKYQSALHPSQHATQSITEHRRRCKLLIDIWSMSQLD